MLPIAMYFLKYFSIEIINGKAGLSIWIGKILITKGRYDFSISYYPDYETSKWALEFKLWKRGGSV